VAVLALATVAAAWLRISLPLIVLVLAPVSIALSLWRAGVIGPGGHQGGGSAAR
jgi:chromate transporter